jgi:hypothetical protein
MFNVNYTLSRLKAMLTACQLKHAITYDVKFFLSDIKKTARYLFPSLCYFYLKISTSLIKL